MSILDAAMTVLANGCYRWLGKQLRGFEKAAPKQLYRRFVETGGTIETTAKKVIIHFDKRCHNPILREAALDRNLAAHPLARQQTHSIRLPMIYYYTSCCILPRLPRQPSEG